MTSKTYRSALIWLLAALFCLGILHNIVQVLSLPHLNAVLWPLNDGDDWLRMVIVRNWLSGTPFYDHSILHSHALFGGATTHWTRLMDMPLAAVAWLLPSSLALNVRVLISASIVPPLMGAVAFFALLGAARRAGAGRDCLYPLAAMVLFCNATTYHFLPGSADHHALQAMLWILILMCCAKRPTAGSSLLTGLLLALSLYVGVEALVLIAAIYALFGLDAVFNPARMRHFLILTFSTAFFSLAALCLETPPTHFFDGVPYDTISIVHITLLFFIAGGVGLLFPVFLQLKTPNSRIVAAAISVAVVALCMYLAFPKFFKGPMVDADPGYIQYLFARANETLPFYKSSARNILWILPLPFVAALTAGTCLKRRRVRWRDVMLFFLLLFSYALMFVQIRWFYYVLPVSIVVILARLPVIIRLYSKHFPRFLRAVTAYQGATLFVLGVIFCCLGVYKALPGREDALAVDFCHTKIPILLQIGAVQKALKSNHGTLYIHPSFAAEAHYFTSADMIISGYYHRETAGLRETQAISDAPTFKAALPLLKKHHVTALLVCTQAYPDVSWIRKLDEKRGVLPNSVRDAELAALPISASNPRLFFLSP